jgi:Flp pilus assembly protein TadG
MTKGQSLVEFVLIIPALVLLLVSMAELSWLAHDYMVLDNNTREIGRLAGKGVDYVIEDWNEEDSSVLAWADYLGLRSASISQYYVTIKVGDDGVTYVSNERMLTRGDTEFVVPNLTPYIKEHQTIHNMIVAEDSKTRPKDLIVVFVKVVAQRKPLTGLFGNGPMTIRSKAVFRVNVLRGLVK